MQTQDGLTVTISPVQMAAILRGKTVSEGETMSNRLWGGLGVVSGVVEMFGAGVLCVVPEPTMLSKAGCVVVGSHSLDTLTASFKQVITGKQSATATAQLAEFAATGLGASPDVAYKVGVTVDLAVPFAFASAAGAARVGSVYSGRIRLLAHEGGTFGHTIARHIGQTPEQMITRLTTTRLSRVSSFNSIKQAELLISEVLSVKRGQLTGALKYMQPEAKLPLEHSFPYPVGRYVDRGSTEVKKAYTVRVIIKARRYGDKTYFILTAYPAP